MFPFHHVIMPQDDTVKFESYPWYSGMYCGAVVGAMSKSWHAQSFRVTVSRWIMQSFYNSFVVSLNKLLNEQSARTGYERPLHSCDFTVMQIVLLVIEDLWSLHVRSFYEKKWFITMFHMYIPPFSYIHNTIWHLESNSRQKISVHEQFISLYVCTAYMLDVSDMISRL